MADVVNNAVALLKEWLDAEEQTIKMTNRISTSTDNPAVKMFMTIIRSDSAKHKLVQEYLLNSLTVKAPEVTFEEIGEISGMINEHLALEQKTVELGQTLAEEINLPIITDLLNYLVDDERKHVTLLNALIHIKSVAQRNT
jgi:rubrerythrin